MGLTHFPNGVSSFGIPQVGAFPINIPKGAAFASGSGKVFFVDGSVGNNGNDGSIDRPVLTIQKAIDLAVSGRQDSIVVYPSVDYEEALTVNKNDLSIIGALGPGGWRVTNKSLAAGNLPALTNSTGQNLSLYNLQLRARGATAGGVVQRANGFRFINCDFMSDGGNGLRLLPGNTDPDDSYTASEGVVYNSIFRDCAGRGLSFENPGPSGGFGGVGVSTTQIVGCYFWANTNQDIIDVDTAGSNDVCFGDCLITQCHFVTRNKAVYMTLTNGGGNTGLISGNFFADDAGLNATKIAIATGIVFAGNFQAAGVVDGSTF